jgi:hypothetical protein
VTEPVVEPVDVVVWVGVGEEVDTVEDGRTVCEVLPLEDGVYDRVVDGVGEGEVGEGDGVAGTPMLLATSRSSTTLGARQHSAQKRAKPLCRVMRLRTRQRQWADLSQTHTHIHYHVGTNLSTPGAPSCPTAPCWDLPGRSSPAWAARVMVTASAGSARAAARAAAMVVLCTVLLLLPLDESCTPPGGTLAKAQPRISTIICRRAK